ncbi:nuclear transport factor 2 family protein [Granulicella arctica]|uniref:nuclear transport factor 2 family protein n=1 Tax=Granulicella arctica TaxID=940613 RepID=UPI0021E05146|nr:nuclear transport factor 2 family protein [Granulicella arctica]
MNRAEDLEVLLRFLEEQLLDPATRSNSEAVAALLADDFREFGSSGRIYTKQQIIEELAAESPRQISLTDFGCQLITSEVALLTYRSIRSTDTASVAALRSSLWIFRNNRWQMLFHQGTRI